MEFESIVLIHRKEGRFLEEGYRIKVETCFNNIKFFYEENGLVFLVLNLEEEFTDEKFDEIFEKFCYDDFEKLDVKIYPKDNEYYPTFIVEMKNNCKDVLQEKINNVLELFMEKVVKIYCNDI